MRALGETMRAEEAVASKLIILSVGVGIQHFRGRTCGVLTTGYIPQVIRKDPANRGTVKSADVHQHSAKFPLHNTHDLGGFRDTCMSHAPAQHVCREQEPIAGPR